MRNPIGLREVADLLGQRYYQIVYAIKSGQVPDVRLRVGNRRLFQQDEIQRLAQHFKVDLTKKEEHAK
jgi:hypothetical protein